MHVQDWSATNPQAMVQVGHGAVNWKKVFAAAKTAGIKNYFIEMNVDLMKPSMPNLNRLEV